MLVAYNIRGDKGRALLRTTAIIFVNRWGGHTRSKWFAREGVTNTQLLF